eukprot:3255153-Prymnesium_polylepis.1
MPQPSAPALVRGPFTAQDTHLDRPVVPPPAEPIPPALHRLRAAARALRPCAGTPRARPSRPPSHGLHG